MKDRLKRRSLYLIGMMGAGKTTVGQILAQRLEYRFFDTDHLIEQLTGETIANIFATEGEEVFRDLETQVLGQLSAYLSCVVATGGGIVLRRKNWGFLHQGVVIHLDLPVEQLYTRLLADTNRPLLQGVNPLEKLQELYGQRQRLYAQADLQIAVDSTDTPEAVADRIFEKLPEILRPPVSPPSVQE